MLNRKKKKKTPLGRVGRVEREQQYRTIVRITTIVVVSLVVLVTIIGLVYNNYIIPSKTIVSVDGEEISTEYFQKRVKLERDRLVSQYNMYYSIAVNITDTTQQQSYLSYLSQIESQLQPDTIGQSVMNQIIDEVFIQREAAARGITVSDQEVDDFFHSLFGYYPNGVPTSTPTTEVLPTSTLSATQYALITPTPEPTATEATDTAGEATPTTAVEPTEVPLPTSITEEEYVTQSSDYLDRLKSYGIDEAFMKDLVRIQLFRDKLNTDIQKGITPEEEQVWARHILVDDEATAQDLLDQLQNGADFGDLARQYSTGPSGPNGGDLGWFGRGQMVTEFEDAAFAAEVGDIVGPVQTTFGFHIIQILGKEMRPVSQTTMDELVYTALTEILNEYKTNADIVFPVEDWIKYTPTEPNVISVLGQNSN